MPGVQQSFRSYFAKYDAKWGDGTCGILCRAWAHRMQHCFDLELSGVVLPDAPFTATHFEDYEEPTEFVELAEASSGALATRVAQIREVLWGK